MSIAEAVKQTLKKNLKVAEVRMTEKNALNNAKNIVKEVKQCMNADKTADIITEIDKMKKTCTVTDTVKDSAWASAALMTLTTSMRPALCEHKQMSRTRLMWRVKQAVKQTVKQTLKLKKRVN